MLIQLHLERDTRADMKTSKKKGKKKRNTVTTKYFSNKTRKTLIRLLYFIMIRQKHNRKAHRMYTVRQNTILILNTETVSLIELLNKK